MSEFPVTDKRTNNGKSTNRIETGGGDLSTTVQGAKHTTAYVDTLAGEYTMTPGAKANIEKFARHNVQETRSGSKSLRGESTVAGSGHRGPLPSDRDIAISSKAARYKIGGERIR